MQNIGHFCESLVPHLALKHPGKNVLYQEGAIIQPPMDGHTSGHISVPPRAAKQSYIKTSESVTMLLGLLPDMESKKKKQTQNHPKGNRLKSLEILEL